MPRSEARIFTSIWKDEEFRGLPPAPQRLYMFLLSQEDLTYCGVLPLRVQRWATKAAGLTITDLEQDIKALEATGRRFVITDTATGELLIRSFMRNDEVWKQPNLMKAARSAAAQVESEAIRAAIREELRRIPAASSPSRLVRDVHYSFTCDMEEGSPNPSANPPENPSTNPSGDIPAGQEDSGKGSGKGSRKGSAKGSAETKPDPSPETSPNPSQEKGEGYGLNQGGLLTPELLPTGEPEKDSPNPSLNPSATAPTAQTILAGFIDWDRGNGGVLTKRTTGQLAKYIDDLLGQGISDRHIRNGLASWRASGQNPSTFDSFVNAAMKGSGGNAQSGGMSAADRRWAEGQALKEELRAEREQQAQPSRTISGSVIKE